MMRGALCCGRHTGSTSGIGLGIATAFAAQGADVLLNGFGDRDQIEAMPMRWRRSSK
jgi:NAD(P)-dependent dehydrogenase (short-subunit alcohol dehydrogenase family)